MKRRTSHCDACGVEQEYLIEVYWAVPPGATVVCSGCKPKLPDDRIAYIIEPPEEVDY